MACVKHCFGFKLRRKHVLIAADDDAHDDNGSVGAGEFNGVKRFSWSEVEKYTTNFSHIIGSGGFSNVYLARFHHVSLGAVKIHSSSERLNQAYRQELELLTQIQHPNIVKLLGYCDERDEGVLIFEYVPNGNLQERLHPTEAKRGVLPWRNRMAVAFQLAQALEYLHDKCPLQIVHGDIKASNILLDEQLNCKLCDFGSAKIGFSSTVLPPGRNRMMLGSPGYTDPHYLRTGLASKKNDVYSFGVVILELVTRREALCSRTGERLTKMADPMLQDAAKVMEMVDPFLNGSFDPEEAKAMASLAARCLSGSPSLRPSASDILETMRSRVPSIFLSSPDYKKSYESVLSY